ncbi:MULTISPECIES: amidohydrolase family protein [unclassified Burkholderia]|uniref:amidohydrolase family protein n=1 Tax=unclassified Burkholderia TaxID=2613784 RepID=UPI001422AA22|nr:MULTISPECIES: amidohydrolase family protein [unclassified Burkholderia]NIE82306.1 amidohydrolase family protein [Burkholderia sp. Tr-860]NIF62807.1 amidohydrolase family protein [Burkholderia sp. Cy-647]NIF94608.1 amidohydrolase family protein [Burkholderia sp. Ax-1720]
MSASHRAGQPGHACPGPDRDTREPAFRLPAGSCDCHVHVFGPQASYPFSEARSYTPEDCTADDLDLLHRRLGIDRAVIVHGGAHGLDNRVTLDALDRAPERLRGVAVIRPGLPRATLDDMHRRGMRGCRMSTVVSGGAGFEHLPELARETAPLGWHLVLHFNRSSELVDVEARLLRTGSDFVLDHMARITAAEGIASPAFDTMMRLLDSGRCWVKLASLYRLSSRAYPHADLLPMIERVVAHRPDRLLWGSNWPHPICPVPMPNDGDLVDLLPAWLPTEALQRQVLVDNPARLYGFDA